MCQVVVDFALFVSMSFVEVSFHMIIKFLTEVRLLKRIYFVFYETIISPWNGTSFWDSHFDHSQLNQLKTGKTTIMHISHLNHVSRVSVTNGYFNVYTQICSCYEKVNMLRRGNAGLWKTVIIRKTLSCVHLQMSRLLLAFLEIFSPPELYRERK